MEIGESEGRGRNQVRRRVKSAPGPRHRAGGVTARVDCTPEFGVSATAGGAEPGCAVPTLPSLSAFAARGLSVRASRAPGSSLADGAQWLRCSGATGRLPSGVTRPPHVGGRLCCFALAHPAGTSRREGKTACPQRAALSAHCASAEQLLPQSRSACVGAQGAVCFSTPS